MDVGLESVQTFLDRPSVHVAKALLHSELVHAGTLLGFLASFANQPFQDSLKILHWAENGDLSRVLLLGAPAGCGAL